MDDNLSNDLEAIREALRVLISKLDRIITEGKQDKPVRGRIEFDDAVIPLIEEGDQWGRHDDPEEDQ